MADVVGQRRHTGLFGSGTTVERRSSPDGLNWSGPQTVELVQPGRAIWHIDVQWIPARAEYWALYNTYAVGTSCATDALYLARSPDGLRWTVYPSPIARAGLIDAFKHLIYKSTFMVDPKATRVTLWMSGASYIFNVGYDWRTATVATSVSEPARDRIGSIGWVAGLAVPRIPAAAGTRRRTMSDVRR